MMTAKLLASWLLGIMVSNVPPGRSNFPDEARESADQGRARYTEIAEALAEVSLDPAEKPVFDGKKGRERTAALMLAIAYHESGLRRDVDLGLGRHHGGGRYFCLMQVAVEKRKGKTPEGWTGADLVASRQRCFRSALHILQRARAGCRKQGSDAWLRLYTSGHCDRGRLPAEKRLTTWRSWLGAHPLPLASL
jgi:hypothetical protein